MAENAVAEVRQLLASVAGEAVVKSLDDEDPFFERGVIDSLRLVEVIDRFQSDFGVEVAGEDLSPENFGSIAGMATYLSGRHGAAQPSAS